VASRLPLGDVTIPESVTAVLVGYDGPPEIIVRAIASLRVQTLTPAQIICVDQSPDGRFAAALRDDAAIEMVIPAMNLGYPSACNLAAAAATGEFILFLNPDARADPGCVEALVAALAADEHAAIAGAQVLLPGREQVNAGDNVLHLSGLSWAGRYGLSPEEGSPRPAVVVSGAALLVRRKAFEAMGGYTEGFFMYYDDVDIAWRSQLLGWGVLFCPAANIVHEYEFQKGNYKWQFLERNRLWCLLAHLELRTLLLLAPLLFAVEVAVWTRAGREGWSEAKLASYRALWAARARLRARRREVQTSRTVNDQTIVDRMSADIDSPFIASTLFNLAAPALKVYRSLLLRMLG
jgi:GT2 family glycosyltransferase